MIVGCLGLFFERRLITAIRKRGKVWQIDCFNLHGRRIRDNIKTSFNAAVKRAGIVGFRFHDLRHTFASQLLLHGGDLKDVQELLGHKTMTMTLRFAHLKQEHKKKAVNLLNNLTGHHATDCHKTVTLDKFRISRVG